MCVQPSLVPGTRPRYSKNFCDKCDSAAISSSRSSGAAITAITTHARPATRHPASAASISFRLMDINKFRLTLYRCMPIYGWNLNPLSETALDELETGGNGFSYASTCCREMPLSEQ